MPIGHEVISLCDRAEPQIAGSAYVVCVPKSYPSPTVLKAEGRGFSQGLYSRWIFDSIPPDWYSALTRASHPHATSYLSDGQVRGWEACSCGTCTCPMLQISVESYILRN